MNFPILPIFSFIHPDQSVTSSNAFLSVLVFAVLLGIGILMLFDEARSNKPKRSYAVAGFVLIIGAAAVAVFGLFNIVMVVVWAVAAYVIIWWLGWKLIIRIVLWRFLIKFVIWRMLIQNAWLAITGREIKEEKKKK